MGNNYAVSKIHFHKKFNKKVIKSNICRFQDRIVSFEKNSEYQPLSIFKNPRIEDKNEALYVLCENKLLYQLIDVGGGKSYVQS